MASEVDICNRALTKLGESRIISLSDNNVAAKACNHAYDYVRDSVFRAHPWNFLMDRTTLAPLSTDPDFEYTYQYQLPGDCIRVMEVYDSSYPWVVEGRKILTDGGTALRIRYMKRETDTNQFDTLFIEALASKLAYELCEELTQSNSKKQAALNDYLSTISIAKMADAQEGSPNTFEQDSWISVRY